MNSYILIGYRHISFQSKDNQKISGYNLIFSYPFSNGEGVMAEKFFYSDLKADRSEFVPVIGQEYSVYFNRFGKLDFVEAV